MGSILMDNAVERFEAHVRAGEAERARRPRRRNRGVIGGMTGEGAGPTPGDGARVEDLAGEEARAESEALEEYGPQTVTLRAGTPEEETIEIRAPKARQWAAALGRMQGIMREVGMIWAGLSGFSGEELKDPAKSAVIAQQMLMRLGKIKSADGADGADEATGPDLEETLLSVTRVVDALAGQSPGWSADLELEDLMQVCGALARVVRPERYRFFFGELARTWKRTAGRPAGSGRSGN